MLPRLLVVTLWVFTLWPVLGQDAYRYVAAPSGLNIRRGPSLDSGIVARLPYGRWVRILDTTEVMLSLRDGGQLITGSWLRISFPPYREAYPKDEIEGYAFGPFLTPAIERIPPHTLKYLSRIYRYRTLPDGTGEYPYQIDWEPPYASDQRTYPAKSPPYFDSKDTPPQLVSQPYQDRQEQLLTPQAVYDTIEAYLHLELLSEERALSLRQRAVANPFAIDTTSVMRDLKPNHWQGDFLLPIDGGRDSIRITDYDGEGYISKQFVGTLPPLGQYVVNEAYEEPNHYFYDQQTGEKRDFTIGYPLITPDGAYVLELYTVYYEEGCTLRLSSLNEDFELVESFEVHFTTWRPRYLQLERFFWLSDREICLQVQPASQEEREPWQWLYLRIE